MIEDRLNELLQEIDEIAGAPETSCWLKTSLLELKTRDPADMLSDIEVMHDLTRKIFDVLIGSENK
jgi:hypothetical protein